MLCAVPTHHDELIFTKPGNRFGCAIQLPEGDSSVRGGVERGKVV